MNQWENLCELTEDALCDIARSMYDSDVKAFEKAITDLAQSGEMCAYKTAAAMLATVPMRAKSAKNNFTDARFGSLENDVYLDMFLNACEDQGLDADGYMPMLMSAQYANRKSALYGWDKSVDRYLTELARVDFDRAADYVDKYDSKFGKYAILIKVDKNKAINRLLQMALYGKNIDKASVRNVLMDYDEVVGVLFSLYGRSSAKERVAIVRLLLTYRNDVRVREFLQDVVSSDSSKTVKKAAAAGIKPKKSKDAAVAIERMMTEGIGLPQAEWKELFNDSKCAAVADRIFFYMSGIDGRPCMLVYDRGVFLKMDDRPIDKKDNRRIYVLHPLDVTEELAAVLPKEIEQPFLQIGRPVYHRIDGERYFSNRLAGTMTTHDEFYENLKKFGFVMCEKRAAGEPNTVILRICDYVIGVEFDTLGEADAVSCGRIAYYNAADVVKLKHAHYISSASPVDSEKLPRRVFSELTYAAYRLFSAA
ncbi:MAG: DUF4132 domain-containing protein [Clostridiales bacterium]|nr:DUF4132 domain-containing protein [Clostridiales bacterium]